MRFTLLVLFFSALFLLGSCDTKTKNVDACGDGFLDPGEACDGSLMTVTSCAELGYYGQTDALSCRSDCTLDLLVCTDGRCGDGIIQAGEREDCDGENLDETTCEDLHLGSGLLACKSSCRWDTSGCEVVAVCGDGTVAAPYESCESGDLQDTTCENLGYYGGELACADDCLSFDESGCVGGCGDGVIQTDEGEQCDGENLDAQTCLTRGFSQGSGALGCTLACAFDETACVPRSTNADLASLAVSSGALTPAFSAGATSYVVTVPPTVTTLTVTATASSPYASVLISPQQPMALNLGSNPVTVTVNAESGTQKVYTVVVTLLPTLDHESPSIGTLKYVPAGTFQRDATSTNLSTVSAFRMSRTEITRVQWTAVTGWADPSAVAYSVGTGDPVQRVNWYDAIAFCNKLSLLEGLTPVYAVSGVDFDTLTYAQIPATNDAAWNAATANWSADGYRLPTEMEWMWAAMGADAANPGVTNATGYAKAFAGTIPGLIGDYAVFGYNSAEVGRTMSPSSSPAASKLANELGLYDLSGNVWEWVWDWYSVGYPAGQLTDYRGEVSGTNRQRRGGDWASIASLCAVAYRTEAFTYGRDSNIGFRVVRP
ncbi:formylglycine-generating enzyme family protein [Myxococcota bacterium]|nr:formylglycine-generating enzyme family protein [Myxococcota bacterium]MBU1410798.1 formylglycine-generating enzyme family protein [Myxococcota bacterium]MBU1510093.1 formylglycine-generating enzyme family protein [Myxococcota bacterium]